MTKSFRPLPDKHAGLTNVEMRFRQRYVDLIVNPKARDVFRKRSRIIREFRNFMEDCDFTEVETPMMHPLAGGANARPFVTHHNALDMELFLRIAPELKAQIPNTIRNLLPANFIGHMQHSGI